MNGESNIVTNSCAQEQGVEELDVVVRVQETKIPQVQQEGWCLFATCCILWWQKTSSIEGWNLPTVCDAEGFHNRAGVEG